MAASSSSVVISGANATLDVSKLNSAGKLKYLREVAANPCRRSASILICAADVLVHGGISDAERATITEMAIIAAIDCGQDEKATEWLRGLVRQFGRTSVRVRKLQGMCLEASGKVLQAAEVYKSVLVDSPVEQYVARRLAAIQRAEGNYKAAIDTIKVRPTYTEKTSGATTAAATFSYAELYPLDEAAARELLSLNWILGNVSECIRYADELVLIDAANYAHFNRVAEMCTVAGHLDRAATAYSHSLRLNPAKNNARAMYGLWHVAQLLMSAKSQDAQHAKDAAGLMALATARLKAVYAGSATLAYLDLTVKD